MSPETLERQAAALRAFGWSKVVLNGRGMYASDENDRRNVVHLRHEYGWSINAESEFRRAVLERCWRSVAQPFPDGVVEVVLIGDDGYSLRDEEDRFIVAEKAQGYDEAWLEAIVALYEAGCAPRVEGRRHG